MRVPTCQSSVLGGVQCAPRLHVFVGACNVHRRVQLVDLRGQRTIENSPWIVHALKVAGNPTCHQTKHFSKQAVFTPQS